MRVIPCTKCQTDLVHHLKGYSVCPKCHRKWCLDCLPQGVDKYCPTCVLPQGKKKPKIKTLIPITIDITKLDATTLQQETYDESQGLLGPYPQDIPRKD